MDGVGAGHQRRVQRGRHLADHLEADEQAEHEDGQVGEQRRVLIDRPPASSAATAGSMTARRASRRCRMAPASRRSGRCASAPSRTRQVEQRGDVAGVGRRRGRAPCRTGRLPAPITVTPLSVTTVASGTRAGDVAAESAGGQVDDDRTRAHACQTASAVTSCGGRRPGTWAVVITMSKPADPRVQRLLLGLLLAPPVSSRAYPPPPRRRDAGPRSRNVAPSDVDLGRGCRPDVVAGDHARRAGGRCRSPAARRRRRRGPAPRPAWSCRPRSSASGRSRRRCRRRRTAAL